MLARLLRSIYLIQLLTGGLIGTWAAVALAPRWGAASLGLVPLAAIGWVLLWQVVIIAVSVWQSHAGGPLLPWWRTFWGELKAALLIFCLRLPMAQANPSILAPTDSATRNALPVLLVHGYICNHRVWDKVAQTLRQHGHPVLALNLEPLFTSIDDYAALVERAVAALRAHTGAPQVALVGHSMGGLAIRAWLRAQGAQQAACIITLGTPHQGTRVPQWFSTPNGSQMAWHSPWLAELGRSETPAKRQLMRIALTQQDNIVYPQREQWLDGAQVTEFSAIGHLQMCLDDGVINWLLRQLDAPH